jgi:hypothetical protein
MFELAVLADGDALLGERLTRSLRTELATVEGVEVQFSAPGTAIPDGAKTGPVIWDAALWVFLGTTTTATARVLIEKIKAWSAKERNRKVRITDGDRVIEITGAADETQERIITKFLENGQS